LSEVLGLDSSVERDAKKRCGMMKKDLVDSAYVYLAVNLVPLRVAKHCRHLNEMKPRRAMHDNIILDASEL
jgi:hypothetical protein